MSLSNQRISKRNRRSNSRGDRRRRESPVRSVRNTHYTGDLWDAVEVYTYIFFSDYYYYCRGTRRKKSFRSRSLGRKMTTGRGGAERKYFQFYAFFIGVFRWERTDDSATPTRSRNHVRNRGQSTGPRPFFLFFFRLFTFFIFVPDGPRELFSPRVVHSRADGRSSVRRFVAFRINWPKYYYCYCQTVTHGPCVYIQIRA